VRLRTLGGLRKWILLVNVSGAFVDVGWLWIGHCGCFVGGDAELLAWTNEIAKAAG
jgi:hypothetical protein